MPDFLDEKRREIKSRIDEIKPLVDEYSRLEAALAALDGVPAPSPSPAAAAGATATARAPRTATRRRGSAKPGTGRRGRPPGSGARAKQALDLVTSKPGITIPEMAEAMGIKQNYLYRVLPGLQKEGKVTKRDRGWHPRA